MRLQLIILTLALLAPLYPALADQDKHPGQALQQQYCQRCHDDSIYTRPDSIIFSLKALNKRVRFCESMAGAHWNEQQINQVIDYLNQRFYKFKAPH